MRAYVGSQIKGNRTDASRLSTRPQTPSFCRLRFIVFVAILTVVCANSAVLRAQSVEEHEAKAAFVLKLVNFVQWPNATSDHNSNLVICIIGTDATSDALQRLAFGKSIDGREIAVRRSGKEGNLSECKVVFIGESEHAHVSTLLQQVPGTGVLTVGETEGFSRNGGIVNLNLADGRIRLEVNPHAAERAHLQISSRLLSLATIVGDGS